MIDVAENIRRMAKKRGFSIRQLEVRAGLGNGSISKWSNGISPKVSSVIAIAEVLDIAPSTLLRETPQREEICIFLQK